MLNFDDLDLVKLKVYDKNFEKNKKIDMETLKFFNSRYNKKELSSYIVVDKKSLSYNERQRNKKEE